MIPGGARGLHHPPNTVRYNPGPGLQNEARMTNWLYQYVTLPQISDDDLQEMMAHIRFLWSKSERSSALCSLEIATVDPRKSSFIWDTDGRVGEPLVHRQTTGVIDIPTFHTFGAPVLFKPSIAEVMASIRFFFGDNWREVGFFWMDDRDLGSEAVVGQFHCARGWCYPVGADEAYARMTKDLR